jgi:hypothetical protein
MLLGEIRKGNVLKGVCAIKQVEAIGFEEEI